MVTKIVEIVVIVRPLLRNPGGGRGKKTENKLQISRENWRSSARKAGRSVRDEKKKKQFIKLK